MAAVIFVIPNLFHGEYRLANFFELRPHLRRSIRLWNVTFICLLALAFLAQVTVVYSRGWILAYYLSTICVLLGLRYLFFRATVLGSRLGLISRATDIPVRHRQARRRFHHALSAAQATA